MSQEKIIIRGARQHNLKNISLEIPRDKLVVITGLSGSGKSSLAFDTIYAEAERRYLESLSTYARQFLEKMEKPDVDYIEGLSPAISIESKKPPASPRSTVGTVTEIYDYLRLLFARVGTPHCYKCGRKIEPQTVAEMVDRILEFPPGTRMEVLAPLVRGRKGEYAELFQQARRDGYVRVRIDGKLYDLEEEIRLDRKKKHNIEVVVDRLIMKSGIRNRLADSLETTLKLSSGLVLIYHQSKDKGNELLFSAEFSCPNCGLSYEEISPRLFSFNSPYGACQACDGLGMKMETGEECSTCQGTRLRRESLAVKVGRRSIAQVTAMSIGEARKFFTSLRLSGEKKKIGGEVIKEIKERLHFLVDVGLNYLTLERTTATLSAGEAERIRLATQIGSKLMGVLYILDEPSIGLHQRDNRRLLSTLVRLRDLGNTVLVVEHDEATIRTADHIIDLGPGAGTEGGWVVASGTLKEITDCPRSLTGQYLRGRLKIEVPRNRHPLTGRFLEIKGARENNLKRIDVKIPLGILTCVTGVSGSGKSTLVEEILYRALAKILHRARMRAGKHDRIEGVENLNKVIVIDQTPIGRTPRSNPATYTGVFTYIRDLFSQIPEARMRGYRQGRFSFNVKGGRCPACQGDGMRRIEMHFLPDIYIRCEVCKGKRYSRETLQVKYKGRNIADVLDMTVEEALNFFKNIPKIKEKLQTLHDVGLGYIKLGQSAPTVSGGEAQRVKLATELSRRGTGKTLYILDEPTTGLHFADIEKLLRVLFCLRDAGNSILVIEHNLDVIKMADYIIDLGPEGGERGGEVIASGTPEEIARQRHSYTGQFLKKVL